MRKHKLLSDQPRSRVMSTVALAQGYARRLVEKQARQSGEKLRDCIPTVARHVKAPPGSIWALLYRPPKRIYDDLLTSLEEAVSREIRREIQDLENEHAAIVAAGGAARRLGPDTLAEVEADLARLRDAVRGGHDRP